MSKETAVTFNRKGSAFDWIVLTQCTVDEFSFISINSNP
jgi:hypothetical protein